MRLIIFDLLTSKNDLSNPFAVRVKARAKQNEIAIRHRSGGTILIDVKVVAAPENGQSNQMVLALLSQKLYIPQSKLSIIHGWHQRKKWIAIDDS